MNRLGSLVVKLAIGAVSVGIALVGAWLVGINPAITLVIVAAILLLAATAQYLPGRKSSGTTTGRGFLAYTLGAGIVVMATIQLIPAARDHTNPPVTGEPEWADPQARELVVRACYGCHSNEVEWPWYSNVAPLSWAISDHVAEGREAVNYSEFDRPQEEADETIEEILEGSMPPAYYTRFGLHADAKLSAEETNQLVAWLRQTPGLDEDEGDRDGESEYDDDEDEDD